MACFILSCKSHSSRKNNNEFVSFHRMTPNDRETWCKLIPRARTSWTRHSRICSKHFTDNSFVCTDKWRRLKPGAIPSLLLDIHEDDELDPLADNFHQNPGGQPLPNIKVEHNYNIKDCADSQVNTLQSVYLKSCHVETVPVNHKGSSQAMEIDKTDIPTSSSPCCSLLANKIRKLENDLKKANKLCSKRLLKMNALRKQTKRLKATNVALRDRLHQILIEEHLEQDKLLMLDAE